MLKNIISHRPSHGRLIITLTRWEWSEVPELPVGCYWHPHMGTSNIALLLRNLCGFDNSRTIPCFLLQKCRIPQKPKSIDTCISIIVTTKSNVKAKRNMSLWSRSYTSLVGTMKVAEFPKLALIHGILLSLLI